MEQKRKLKGIADLYKFEDEKRARSLAPVAGHDIVAGPAIEAGHDTVAGPAKTPSLALPEAGHATLAGPATETEHEAPAPDLLASLPTVAGYLKLGNQIVDHLLPQLEPFEQLVYLQLYRLSHGNGKPSCLISIPKLARRTKISERSLWRALASLNKMGLVTRGESVHGKGKEQGITFWIATPSGPAREASPAREAGPATVADNKRKNQKKDLKGEMASPNFQNCPDCHGTGFHYVDEMDRGKGVEKCAHRNLKAGQQDTPTG